MNSKTNNYIAYRYSISTNNARTFLFGFLMPYNYYIDTSHYSKKIDINVAKNYNLEIECSVLDTETYDIFTSKVSDGLFSFELLKFDCNEGCDKEKDILYKTEAFLEVPKYDETVISSHKYTNLWLFDDLADIDFKFILPTMNDYARLFFIKKTSMQRGIAPFGSFFIMKDTMILKEDFISTRVDLKKPRFSLELSENYDFTNHKAHLILNSAAHQVVVNKIIYLSGEKTKCIDVSEPVPEQTIEIFNSSGDLIYFEHSTRLMKVGIGGSIMGQEITIDDKFSKKNSSSKTVNTTLIKTNMNVDITDIFKKNYKPFYDYTDKLYGKINSKEERCEESYWFEKMSNEDCISKIRELVSEVDEAVFVDPYFESLDSLDSPEKDKITLENTQNLFAILVRLKGKVTIISATQNANFLKGQCNNSTDIFSKIGLSITLKKSDKSNLHDRYLLLKKNNKYTLYSLTTSLNASMSGNPLGIFSISGETKERIVKYIKELLCNSQEVYNTEISKKEHRESFENKEYLKELIGDINLDESYIKDNFSEIKDKFYELKIKDENIALLALAEIVARILPSSDDYKEVKNILLDTIGSMNNKIDFIKKVEKYLVEKYFVDKKGFILAEKINIPEEFTMETYKEVSLLEQHARCHVGDLCGWGELLFILFELEPDSFMDWSKNANNDLKKYVYQVIYRGCHSSPKKILECNNIFLKLLALHNMLDGVLTTDNLEKVDSVIDKAINAEIPPNLIYCIIVYNHHSFDVNNKNYDEKFISLLKNDIFADMIGDSNFGSFKKDLFDTLDISNKFWIVLFKHMVESNLIDKKQSTKLVIEFFTRYFDKPHSIFWFSLSSDYTKIYDITNIIKLFDSTNKKKILQELLAILNIESDYKKTSMPLFNYVTSHTINSELSLKINIFLYVFCVCAENSVDYIYKPINALMNMKKNKTIFNVHMIFLFIKGIFYSLINKKDSIKNDESIIIFFEYLKSDEELKFFYDIYNKSYSEEALNNLFDLISEFRIKKIYPNDEEALLNISLNIICSIICNKYEDDKNTMKGILNSIENKTNEYFNNNDTVILPKCWESL